MRSCTARRARGTLVVAIRQPWHPARTSTRHRRWQGDADSARRRHSRTRLVDPPAAVHDVTLNEVHVFRSSGRSRNSFVLILAITAAVLGMLPRVGCICSDGTHLAYCGRAFTYVLTSDGDREGQDGPGQTCSCCVGSARDRSSPVCPQSGQPCRIVVDQSNAGPMVEVVDVPRGEGMVVATIAVSLQAGVSAGPASELAPAKGVLPESLLSLGMMLRV
jgi:hypothetical protein